MSTPLPPWAWGHHSAGMWPGWAYKGEATIHHQHTAAGRRAGLPGRDHPSEAWSRAAGSSSGAAGERGSSKTLFLCLCPTCLTSVPPSHILSSQHSDVPKAVEGTLRPQLGYSRGHNPQHQWPFGPQRRQVDVSNEEVPKPCMGEGTQQWPHSLGSP